MPSMANVPGTGKPLADLDRVDADVVRVGRAVEREDDLLEERRRIGRRVGRFGVDVRRVGEGDGEEVPVRAERGTARAAAAAAASRDCDLHQQTCDCQARPDDTSRIDQATEDGIQGRHQLDSW
jgi:hypothetical protein